MASTATSVSDESSKSGRPRTPIRSPILSKLFGSREQRIRRQSPLKPATRPKNATENIDLQQGRVLEKARLYDEMVKGSAPAELAKRREKVLDLTTESGEADMESGNPPMMKMDDAIAIMQRLEAIETRIGITVDSKDESSPDKMTTVERVAPEKEMARADLETKPSESNKSTKRKLKRKKGKCVVM